jgi:hypothetical protein
MARETKIYQIQVDSPIATLNTYLSISNKFGVLQVAGQKIAGWSSKYWVSETNL